MTAPLLQLQNLRVDIETPKGRAPILRHLDLSLAPGQRLGIIGESGSGKSMMALAIMGLLPTTARTRGRIALEGEDLLQASERRLCQVRGRRVAMVFQEPMSALNPVRSIGDQIAEGPRLHLGLGRTEAIARAKDLLNRVGLHADRFPPGLFPHQLSGGQRQRVMIAIALACEPALLIADEPTTALDVTTQVEILDLISTLASAAGMGLIMISHDLGVIARTTSHMAVMYAGRIVEQGPTSRLLHDMAHPYTQGLLAAMPQHMPASGQAACRRRRLPTIPGVVPDPLSSMPGCPFANRCRHAEVDCRETEPALAEVGPTHQVACHHPKGAKHVLELVS